ncbi:MAG TPA: hypothetical protein DIT64_04925 [Verrucomicrobiales bacterium]|nr:hypothetical protein [Verrucomicrobiales bacterium]
MSDSFQNQEEQRLQRQKLEAEKKRHFIASRDLDRDGDVDLADDLSHDMNRDGRINANDRDHYDLDGDNEIDAADRTLAAAQERQGESVGQALGMDKTSEGWQRAQTQQIKPQGQGVR